MFTPTLIGEVKFGVNQTIYHTANLSPVPYGVSVSGFSPLTGASTTDYPSKTFDLIYNLSWAKGKHFIKFGFETRWMQLNQGTSESGTLTYNTAADFQNNNMGSATYTAILPLVRQRKTQYCGYAQDEWKATPNLTITAGVRYNVFNALHAIGDNAVPFDFGTCGGYCPRAGHSFIRDSTMSIRESASRGHMARPLCALAAAFITRMARKTIRTFRSRIRSTAIPSATLPFPALSYPLTPY